jgi:tRNA (guanine-N7-)-methyltransferase
VSKKKLIHFQENLIFPHLFQLSYKDLQSDFKLKSGWKKGFFMNQNPVIVELGCGKGEYTVGLAVQHPDKNYIGIDLKGARLWRGCKSVEELNLKNAGFIRTRVDNLEKLFGTLEVDEIWITFPDPQPGKERKRLTSPFFLDKYKKVLKEEGIIHLKTDDPDFFSYTLETLKEGNHHILFTTEDLYHSGLKEDVTQIQTYYEKIWLEKEKKICYLKFKLNRFDPERGT